MVVECSDLKLQAVAGLSSTMHHMNGCGIQMTILSFQPPLATVLSKLQNGVPCTHHHAAAVSITSTPRMPIADAGGSRFSCPACARAAPCTTRSLSSGQEFRRSSISISCPYIPWTCRRDSLTLLALKINGAHKKHLLPPCYLQMPMGRMSWWLAIRETFLRNQT